MVLHQTVKATLAAVVMLVSSIRIAVAEEIAPAVRVEANVAGSCYSADVGFGSFWMTSGGFLDRIDLVDNSIMRVSVKGLQSHHSSTAIGKGAVWLLEGLTTLYKIDPQKEQVVKEVPIELDGSGSLELSEGAAWAIPMARD